MTSIFALCDCNNFYVSCERVFNARLINHPVLVLSNNDGCVIARSEEAKALGIKMGTPLFQAQHIIDAHDIQVFSSNYALYGDMSHRVMSVLGEFTPQVELYSIDEAFMQLEPPSGHGSLNDLGRAIQRTTYKWTGIPVSIGMAETKTLAKLANQLAKKSDKAQGVLDLTQPTFLDCALERTPVERVWGIGRQYAKLLRARGITTARALRDVDLRWARKALTVVGARIVEELRGNSCLSLEICPRPKRSLTHSRSFGQTVETISALREAIASFTTRVAEKLRAHKLAAGAITVFVASNRFSGTQEYYSNSATIEMAYPTDVTHELLERAVRCAEKLYKKGCRLKSAGVMLTALIPASPITARMYNDEKWQRARRAMRAVDEVNRRMGRDKIRVGARELKPEWRTKFEHRSPRFTTNWKEILAVSSR
jgi:DNA polymerase V